MSTEELIDAGFNMDPGYEPLIAKHDMKEGESMDTYYLRSHNFIKRLLKISGELLVVGKQSLKNSL